MSEIHSNIWGDILRKNIPKIKVRKVGISKVAYNKKYGNAENRTISNNDIISSGQWNLLSFSIFATFLYFVKKTTLLVLECYHTDTHFQQNVLLLWRLVSCYTNKRYRRSRKQYCVKKRSLSFSEKLKKISINTFFVNQRRIDNRLVLYWSQKVKKQIDSKQKNKWISWWNKNKWSCN